MPSQTAKTPTAPADSSDGGIARTPAGNPRTRNLLLGIRRPRPDSSTSKLTLWRLSPPTTSLPSTRTPCETRLLFWTRPPPPVSLQPLPPQTSPPHSKSKQPSPSPSEWSPTWRSTTPSSRRRATKGEWATRKAPHSWTMSPSRLNCDSTTTRTTTPTRFPSLWKTPQTLTSQIMLTRSRTWERAPPLFQASPLAPNGPDSRRFWTACQPPTCSPAAPSTPRIFRTAWTPTASGPMSTEQSRRIK